MYLRKSNILISLMTKVYYVAILLVATFAVLGAESAAAQRMLPVENVSISQSTENEVTVKLMTQSTSTVSVFYSINPIDLASVYVGAGQSEYALVESVTVSKNHTITIDDLSPDTRYFFRLFAEDVDKTSFTISHEYEFTTNTPDSKGAMCTYLAQNVMQDAENDPKTVRRLQSYLNVYEGENLSISGVYDAETIAAVNRFQIKFTDTVLKPWGLSQPTGNTYITTRAQINSHICGTSPSYADSELKEIEAYRNEPVVVSLNQENETIIPENETAEFEKIPETPTETSTSSAVIMEYLISGVESEVLDDIHVALNEPGPSYTYDETIRVIDNSAEDAESELISVIEKVDSTNMFGVVDTEQKDNIVKDNKSSDPIRHFAALTATFIDAYSLPILIVLVVLLVVQLWVIFRKPHHVKLADE